MSEQCRKNLNEVQKHKLQRTNGCPLKKTNPKLFPCLVGHFTLLLLDERRKLTLSVNRELAELSNEEKSLPNKSTKECRLPRGFCFLFTLNLVGLSATVKRNHHILGRMFPFPNVLPQSADMGHVTHTYQPKKD